MSIQGHCVVCAHSLKNPHRSDARYCGSTCRVRAFRARRGSTYGQSICRRVRQRQSDRSATQTQLAAFHELRQTRKKAAALRDQLAGRTEEVGRLKARLATVESIALAQRALLSKTTEQLKENRTQHGEITALYAEGQRMARLVEAAREQNSRELTNALQLAREQAEASKAVRATLEADAKEAATLAEQLRGLQAALSAQRSSLAEAREQLAAERRQTALLRDKLAEREAALQAERTQLDETAQALNEARAAASHFVSAEKFAAAAAELSTAKQQLAERTSERDEARQAARVAVLAAQRLEQRAQAAEATLAERTELLKELGPKLQKAYAQILLIKEKRDWRL